MMILPCLTASHGGIAVRALKACFDDTRGVGFAWVAMLAFLRLSTRNGIFPRPLTTDEAFLVVDQWLGHPRARVANPGERHAEILAQLLKSAGPPEPDDGRASPHSRLNTEVPF
jgi:hypothetical protein